MFDEERFDEPGMSTPEQLLFERAVRQTDDEGGLAMDLMIAVLNAGLDPEEVQRAADRRRAARESGYYGLPHRYYGHETRHEYVPRDDPDYDHTQEERD